MKGYARRRDRMVERDIRRRGLEDAGVLEAMRRVPREEFVPVGLRRLAYEDSALPIPRGQTISQPYIVALMLSALELAPERSADEAEPERARGAALDVGTGSGYAAAVLSLMIERVYTIERHEELARRAHERFERLGYQNIEVRHGDGSRGWPEHSPYRGIVVAAAAPRVPPALRDQLDLGGRLVVPVSEPGVGERLLRVARVADDRFEEETLTAVRFVPLVSDDPD